MCMMNHMFFLLKGQWSIVPDRSYFLNQVAWGIIIAGLIFFMLVALWSMIRRPLSRFMKVKEAYVEIVYVPRGVLDRDAVGVRFLKPRKFGRKGFLMKGDDLVIGDKGILRYQGVYGLSFQLEAHIIKKDYHQKFGFMVHKQRKAQQQMERPERKKRKYW